MIEAFPLLIAAVAFRASGAMVRGHEHGFAVRLGGWAMCGSGVWLAMGAAGAWFPYWPALAIAVAAAGADLASGARWRWGIRAATDATIVAMCGFFSAPPLSMEWVAVLAAAIVIVGLALDQLPRWGNRTVHLAGFAIPAALALSFAFAIHLRVGGSEVDAWYRHAPMTSIANLSISRPLPGYRIELSNRTAAWLLEQPDAGPHPAAVLLHGAHRLGSRQGAACLLQRALQQAGFVVLSIDHPGYGETPPPQKPHSIAAWDSLPATLDGIELLAGRDDIDVVFVIGHSMGAAAAIQALALGADVDKVILFGAATSGDDSTRDAYWHRRFHSDRQLVVELDRELVRQLRQHYSASRFVGMLDESHPPIVFANFGVEHPNITRGRDDLFEAIPGRKRSIHLVDTTHYFNTFSNTQPVLMGDARTVRMLSQMLRSTVNGLRAERVSLDEREVRVP